MILGMCSILRACVRLTRLITSESGQSLWAATTRLGPGSGRDSKPTQSRREEWKSVLLVKGEGPMIGCWGGRSRTGGGQKSGVPQREMERRRELREIGRGGEP